MVFMCDQMVVCVVVEFEDGVYVNFGIGFFMLVLNYVLLDVMVVLQFENGIFGVGLYFMEDVVDLDFINVGKEMVMILLGVVFFDFVISFGMICGGKIDVVIFGVMQVFVFGDFVNWMIFGKMVKGFGGVMDFVYGVGWVIVFMEYVVKDGFVKIVDLCMFLLIGCGVVDCIIIDLVVIDVMEVGFIFVEMVFGVVVEDVIVVMELLFIVVFELFIGRIKDYD